jgi:hypothetical protein
MGAGSGSGDPAAAVEAVVFGLLAMTRSPSDEKAPATPKSRRREPGKARSLAYTV